MTKGIDTVNFSTVDFDPSWRRVSSLRASAGGVFSAQAYEIHRYRRGWVGAMTRVDNYARGDRGLPTYEQESGPVRAYVEFVNGEQDLLNQLLVKVEEQFGAESAQTLRAHIQEHLKAESDSRLKYVPPGGYTYAMFRLDDELTRELSLF